MSGFGFFPIAKLLGPVQVMLGRALVYVRVAKRVLTWEDVLPIFAALDSMEEVRELVSDPVAFVDKLGRLSSPAARRLALAKAKPLIMEALPDPLTWEDALSILGTLDSMDEVRELVSDPAAFMDKLGGLSSPAARKLALAKAKPQIVKALPAPLTSAASAS